jgi:hypothetical protein
LTHFRISDNSREKSVVYVICVKSSWGGIRREKPFVQFSREDGVGGKDSQTAGEPDGDRQHHKGRPRPFLPQIARNPAKTAVFCVVGSFSASSFFLRRTPMMGARMRMPFSPFLARVSQAQLDQVVLRLNQRPRKTLGFQLWQVHCN